MNFQVVFKVISSLSFVFEFPINLDTQQDYFYFEGENQHVYLSRTNNTLVLYMEQGTNFSHYSETINQSTFTFSWMGFEVDGTPMKQVKSEGEVFKFNYINLLFMSPILNELEPSTCSEQVFYYDSVNYWYIILIVLIAGITYDSKERGVNLMKNIFLALHKIRFSRLPQTDTINTSAE